ncbi:MAG: SNF2 family helicase [Verrucomicrobia bacterium]|nr:SNF2 family helicase [Verrucomicrobiota bacterium]
MELTESLLREAAGWQAMKMARAYLAQGQVLSSFWEPPLLRGVVQTGESSFRASMVIKDRIDIENLCHCRDSRQWGKICAHSVAVGLHWLKAHQPHSALPPGRSVASVPPAPSRKSGGLPRDAAGDPAQLCIILPPNLDQALTRGRAMLVFEAKWSRGRCPLNALPKGRTFAFSARDDAILDRVEALTGGETPAMMQLDLKQLAALLPALVGHEQISLGKTTAVTLTQTPLAIPLRATLENNGEIVVALKGQGAPPTLIEDWVWQDRTFQPLGLPHAVRDVFRGPIRIPRSAVPPFLTQHWPQLMAAGGMEANFALEDFILEPQSPRFILELKGGLTQLTALLQCAYASRIMTLGVTDSGEDVWLPDPDVPTRYSTRDTAAERSALGRLQRSGFTGPDARGILQLSGQNAVLNFFAREHPRLQQEWTVTLDEHLEERTMKKIERVEPRFEITPSGVQWFDLGVVFESTGGQRFDPADVHRLLRSGQGHTRLKNGRLAVIDTGAVEELQQVLLDCAPQQHPQGYRIRNAQAGFLESTLRQHASWRVQAPAAWRTRAARQSGEATLACPPLGKIETVLRPYQKHGVAWLMFLRENGFGGILADEMGLGKTLQTLAHLNTLRIADCGLRSEPSLEHGHSCPPETGGTLRADKNVRAPMAAAPHLIICPTSLVFNWVAEARKFTPDLRVLALHGPDRHERFREIPSHDIIITSYALIRRDAARYRDLEFDTVVLDEAQHIKNRQTQNAQAVKAVCAQHRIVLTGTPLENSVLDLWSIFDFLMPGYLGAASDFRERYELPISKERNAEAQSRLARRLRPFMLRRLKREVAADLPEKIEQISFCELTKDQRAVYQQVIEATRKEVLEATGAQGEARIRMVALNALLRLRQVCCDLRLLKLKARSDGVMEDGSDEATECGLQPSTAPAVQSPASTSGKLDLFSELLEEVIDGGHRVLVFSQFVSMLTLLKEHLSTEGIEFCYLDGSTRDRAAVVQQFQGNTTIPVFLISLKAGGVGLNLTGADTVIHFDPWWNPAVEDQATDRAHRLGQTRVVTSYKLIARDTVEEKIVTLQNRKRDIIKATLGGEEEFAAALSWEEIQELLT